MGLVDTVWRTPGVAVVLGVIIGAGTTVTLLAPGIMVMDAPEGALTSGAALRGLPGPS